MKSFSSLLRIKPKGESSRFATAKVQLTPDDVQSFFDAADSRDHRTNAQILEAVFASDRRAVIQVARSIKRFKRALIAQNVDPSRYKEFL